MPERQPRGRQAALSYGASRAATPFGTPEEIATEEGHADLAAWLVASRGWTPLAHLETLTAARALSLLRSGASLHEGEPTPLQRAAGGAGADANTKSWLNDASGPRFYVTDSRIFYEKVVMSEKSDEAISA